MKILNVICCILCFLLPFGSVQAKNLSVVLTHNTGQTHLCHKDDDCGTNHKCCSGTCYRVDVCYKEAGYNKVLQLVSIKDNKCLTDSQIN